MGLVAGNITGLCTGYNTGIATAKRKKNCIWYIYWTSLGTENSIGIATGDNIAFNTGDSRVYSTVVDTGYIVQNSLLNTLQV